VIVAVVLIEDLLMDKVEEAEEEEVVVAEEEVEVEVEVGVGDFRVQ
jgi:hypothetical protein